MRGALGSPRLLLRRLREVMAEPVSAQERLDKVVVVIASNMVAEVCSVYVLRVDGTLELYATEGLNPEAVHLTTMRLGEGIVGTIARDAEPLALSDAQQHPAFSYKPETGEEIYHSFLGVPILRAGNTLGVLVVQNRAQRIYTEEEVEALQTTAMVLAEMIASGELQALAKPGADIAVRRSLHLHGVALADGVGLGHVVLHEPRVVVKDIIADDPQRELIRLDEGIATVRETIDRLVERGDIAHHGEHRDVLETVRMFANDQGWIRRVREVVTTGLTAEAAVKRVQSDVRARMLRQTDPYLRDRLHDLDELSDRLLHALAGEQFGVSRDNLPENAVLVARSMGPAALLDYDRSRLRGLVLEEGGAGSHIAIVARALGIPAVSEIAGITGLVESGDAIIVDGSAADVQVRPQPDVEGAYAEKARLRARRQEQYKALRELPAVTLDGERISLNVNAGLLVDLPHVSETNADGVGLFRTELQFMIAERMPSTSEQEALYRQVLDELAGAPVTFRTLDIGGDKVLPYMQTVDEENPALGWRAIRIGLDRPGLLRAQVRALLRACGGRALKVMFPMVATVEEFIRAKAIVTRELAYLRKLGHVEPASIAVGVMVEVPSLVFQIDELVSVADFLSIGSNDLMQFLFAADRDNRQVAERFDPLSAPLLRALRTIHNAADTANKPVTLCGEIGGRPLEAMALIGLGYRSFSMSPASIGPVKAMLLSLDAAAISAEINRLLSTAGDRGTLRQALAGFAAARGIPV
ncbi:phosphoenolpyruvate--protein phosphotransferase [Pseudochelatococcus sp. B33]